VSLDCPFLIAPSGFSNIKVKFKCSPSSGANSWSRSNTQHSYVSIHMKPSLQYILSLSLFHDRTFVYVVYLSFHCHIAIRKKHATDIFNRNYSAILATLQITSYALGVYISLLFTCQLHECLIKLYFNFFSIFQLKLWLVLHD